MEDDRHFQAGILFTLDTISIYYYSRSPYDFSGKTIIPFSTHGGSRMSGTEDVIRKLQPKANVHEGFAVSRNIIRGNPETGAVRPVADWLSKLEY